MQACFRSIERIDDFSEIIGTNYTALVYTARRAVELLQQPQNNQYRPYEKACTKPIFVATVGISGTTGIPEWSLYSGAKHAANGFLKALRRQVKDSVDVLIGYPNLLDSSRVETMLLANGEPAGVFGEHVLKQWWFRDELNFQDEKEAAERYHGGICR